MKRNKFELKIITFHSKTVLVSWKRSRRPKDVLGSKLIKKPKTNFNCGSIYLLCTHTPTHTQTNKHSHTHTHTHTHIYHHPHHVVPLARISLTLSRHFSLSFIASGRSSGLHPVSSHSCCMYVRAGCHAFARPYVGVHKSTSLMSSSLLLQQCPACLVRLTWIVFTMGGLWSYSWCFVGCFRQDLFNIARNILV